MLSTKFLYHTGIHLYGELALMRYKSQVVPYRGLCSYGYHTKIYEFSGGEFGEGQRFEI